MTRFLVTLCVAASLSGAASAPAQMGPGLDLSWNSLDCGGGTSTGGVLTLIGTIAQPDAGAMTSGGLELVGGFFGGTEGPPPCYPDCNQDALLTVADFGCFQTKFVAGDPYADCNQSGTLTVADFGCFQTRFVAGCP
jgi:hypothetical protein